MSISYILRFSKALPVIICLLFTMSAHAQLSAAVHYRPTRPDTSDININDLSLKSANKATTAAANESNSNTVKINFIENLETHLSNRQERKLLMGYLKELSADNSEITYNQSKVKLYYRLANVFARLRLYPLAMKCFFKTIKQNKVPGDEPSTSSAIDSLTADSAAQQKLDKSGYLAINSSDDSLFVNNPRPTDLNDKTEKKSKAITYDRITGTFNDGKKAAAYALLFHVKQPVPGKPKVFKLANTGHTFITLIKYNTDSSSVSVSFGFYPQKDNLIFSATPWNPTCSGTFKNDNDHNWDEVLGRFISKRRFDRIMKLIKDYDGLDYHLSKNNCTDFALKAASFAGFGVTETKGSWPLGHGNNPGTTGQGILSGAVSGINGTRDIFVDYDKSLLKNN
ncbi:hypothetical protein [Mucilaginibacter dorajii]|uniref:DUF4105 domain-containing protein n=1 Tax=Mucilaginibacter dorajii TaxID=692994 RepID=A0ABP7QBC7_9SPHI|nr:hypothetical protein [Mucilaginibacter dorajii]MCS3733121.1 hypothetical protein [Mucilaginibacter dorajii]